MKTINHIKSFKEKITMTTAYDATMARLVDGFVDIILVGDSLGMVVQGHSNTIPVSLEHAIYHTECVARVTKESHIVGDLPFMSYQISPEQALESAGKLMKAGAHSVKLEGGVVVAEQIRRIVNAGIPVMGHVGLTPQSVHSFGGFKRQGKTEESIRKITEDVCDIRDAGAYAVVLECIPSALASMLTNEIAQMPTIGIGSGPYCNGQVLVSTDILGMNPDFCPKFAKKYLDGAKLISKAFDAFQAEVKCGVFPKEK